MAQSALDHLNHEVDIKLKPRTTKAKTIAEKHSGNPYFRIKTKLIKRLLDFYDLAYTKVCGNNNSISKDNFILYATNKLGETV